MTIVGHDYIGHNYMFQACIGPNCIGHGCVGHDYVGHNYIGHTYRIETADSNVTTASGVKRNGTKPEKMLRNLNQYLGRDGSQQNLCMCILDCCREIPEFQCNSSRSGTAQGGLAAMQTRGGTMVLYACDVGKKADDGRRGEHGTLTAQLLDSMREGRRPADVFNEVSQEVSRVTGGKQVPWILVNHFPETWKFTSRVSTSASTASRCTDAAEQQQTTHVVSTSSPDAVMDDVNPATKRQLGPPEAELLRVPKAAKLPINAPGQWDVMLSYRSTYLKQILSSYAIFLIMVKYMARPVVERDINLIEHEWTIIRSFYVKSAKL